MAIKKAAVVSDGLFGTFPGPRILIYHQVGTNLGREMEVPTDVFAEQLAWLQTHGRIVNLDEAIERRLDPGSHKLFVVTFDDGFKDMYDNAFPFMMEHAIPFTLYLTTRPIETGNPLDPQYPDAVPLTWDQVTNMLESGLVTLGAHTHRHFSLRGASAGEIADDLNLSNNLLRERTGIGPCHFTYPWGWWSETADPLVRELYKSATVGGGPPIGVGCDLFRLSRIPIQRSDSESVFRRRMTSGLRLERAARRSFDRYLR